MEVKDPSPNYIKGYNTGYVMREYKPNLALNLSQTKFPESEKEFSSGFRDGMEQKEMELRKDRIQNNSFGKFKAKSKDIDKDL